VGHLITTTVGGVISRIYDYSQDGDLISANVDGLLTTFAYNGNGQRLLMSVAGQVTTYTLDYAREGNRVLFEVGSDESKHYLYGLQCLGEVVTDHDNGAVEKRYYQYDGNNLVRQTTNEEARVTFAWTFSPEGAVLLGEKGPVTHLGCGDDAIYDWSTGLIFKGGRYFDPNLGIWLSTSTVLFWQSWYPPKQGRRKRRREKRSKRYLLLLLLMFLALMLAGCNQPDPLPECPTPSPTPAPMPYPSPNPSPGPSPSPSPSPSPAPPPPPTPDPPTPLPPSPTPSPPPSPSPTPEPPTPSPFPLAVRPAGVNQSTFDRYKMAWETLRDKHESENQSLHDVVVIGFIIWTEIKSIENVAVPWGEALEAVSYQYSSKGYHFTNAYGLETCAGHCDTIEKELRWLNEMEAFFKGDISLILSGWSRYQSTAQLIQNAPPSADVNQGSYQGPISRNSHVWGNYYPGTDSLMENYIDQSGWDDKTAMDKVGQDRRRELAPWWEKAGPPLQAHYQPSGLVIFSGEQNRACKSWEPSCVGWR
jgi:hypothetical protein